MKDSTARVLLDLQASFVEVRFHYFGFESRNVNQERETRLMTFAFQNKNCHSRLPTRQFKQRLGPNVLLKGNGNKHF